MAQAFADQGQARGNSWGRIQMADPNRLCYHDWMRLGSLALESNLFLSPLAGYTNLPFRLTVREVGGLGLATTDLLNARSLLEKNPKALKLIETSAADRPLAVQLFGSVQEEMRDAAGSRASIGMSSVDINMGCPVRKICRVGGGSAMMTELDKTAALVKIMVEAVRVTITAKMRLGWGDENRSEEGRVGEKGRARWAPSHLKKKKKKEHWP